MIYLLDSNVVIGLFLPKPALARRIRLHATDDFGIPTIVMHELYFGAIRSAKTVQNFALLAGLRFPILPFTEQDARQAAEIRAALVTAGTPIGPYDTLIAGQARTRDLTLITRNIREFERVPGLKLENWEA